MTEEQNNEHITKGPDHKPDEDEGRVEPEATQDKVSGEDAEDSADEPVMASMDRAIPEPSGNGSDKKKKGKSKVLFGLLGVLLVVLLAAGGVTGFVYTQSPTNDTVRNIVSVVPYPAAVVNWQPVSFQEYLNERDALANYMNNAPQGAEQNLSQEDVMDTLLNKVAVEQYAQQNDITLEQSRVDEYSNQVMGTGQQREQFKSQLESTFGWSVEEFENRVVESVVLASQVNEYIQENESIQSERKEIAQNALERVENGEDFDTVAEEVSGQFSAAQGGDIGEVPASELPEQWRDSVEELEVGDHSDVISGTSAYLVFKMNDRVEPETEEASPELSLSVIVVPKKTLQEVVDAYLEDAKVWKFI
jgi:parvulin-like peptidyl-prolyl isomerase